MNDFSKIETPAVLVDLNRTEANIDRVQRFFESHNIHLRPHVKTHKIAKLAKAQLAAGASGITCQKIGEAEVMAAAGIDNILITYNILGATKLGRLAQLSREVKNLSVTVDNAEVVAGLAKTFNAMGAEIAALIECDTGGGRCGVQSPAEAVELAELAVKTKGVRFAGLMTYPAIGAEAETSAFFAETLNQLAKQKIDCAVVSSGGSPGMWRAHEVPEVTEYRVGTYIFGDRSMVERDVYDWSHCAMTVLATVVSRPTQNRAIIDAGSKVFSSDLLGMQGHGSVKGRDHLHFARMSEEHGVLTWENGVAPEVGDVIEIIPNHCCVVTNLANQLVFHRDGRVVSVQDVDARGLTQ